MANSAGGARPFPGAPARVSPEGGSCWLEVNGDSRDESLGALVALGPRGAHDVGTGVRTGISDWQREMIDSRDFYHWVLFRTLEAHAFDIMCTPYRELTTPGRVATNLINGSRIHVETQRCS